MEEAVGKETSGDLNKLLLRLIKVKLLMVRSRIIMKVIASVWKKVFLLERMYKEKRI